MVVSKSEFILRTVIAALLLMACFFETAAQSITLDFGDHSNHCIIQTEDGDQADRLQWVSETRATFQWPERYASRTDAERDGVRDTSLEFVLRDIVAGTYNLQFALDAAKDDSLQATFYLDDEPLVVDAQSFRVPGEPYQDLKPQFRIIQFEHRHDGGDLAVSIRHPHDEVRLLQMRLLPMKSASSERERWIESLIRDVGTYQGRALSLGEILWQLENHDRRQWSDYWLQQVKLLHRAEELFDLKGWEWARKKDGLTLISRSQQIAMLIDPLTKDTDHLLFERALTLKSKVLFHLNLEYGGDHEYTSAQMGLRELANRYPQDTILGMYTGQRFRSANLLGVSDLDTAPAWAKWQRACMGQLRKLVHYWVTERQAPNGEFGGKLGDDVEALRFWEPLIYSGDSLASLGWSRLYEGVWNSTHIHEGYAKRVADVEHAAEFISDTEPAMMIITDDEKVHDRALSLYHHFDTLWSGVNDQGLRLFKSAWYSSTAIDSTPPRNRDVDYNARAMKALRYYLFRYPDNAEVSSALSDWSAAWVEVAQSTAKGKPRGILPPSIEFPSGLINGAEATWWEANMLWEYFDFIGASLMLDQLLFTYWMTGDEALLKPLEASLKLVADHRDEDAQHTPGSEAWAAKQYRDSKHWWSIASQYRLLTGNKGFDEVLKESGSAYLNFLISDRTDLLLPELEAMYKALTTNWPMLTTESIYTDRIYGYYDKGFSRLETNILKAMLTGDMCLWGTSPYMTVTWQELPEDCSVLVDKDRSNTQIKIYNHSADQSHLQGRLWHLPEGEYQTWLGTEVLQQIQVSGIEASTEIDFNIGPGLNLLRIVKVD